MGRTIIKSKLEIIYLPYKKLFTFPGNPRRSKDLKVIEKLKKLISLHGFQNPLQIWQSEGKYYILCGNHRFRAGKEIGMIEFPCIEYKGTREEAFARVISDNKSSEWTEWDYPLLKQVINDIDTDLTDIEITGFTAEELGSIFDFQVEKNWDSHFQSNVESKIKDKKIVCPHCNMEITLT